MGPAELPQTVAAFHSLVGLAAAGTAVGDYMLHMNDPAATADAVRMSAVYLASFIGGATATGSIVAFGKLQVLGCALLCGAALCYAVLLFAVVCCGLLWFSLCCAVL